MQTVNTLVRAGRKFWAAKGQPKTRRQLKRWAVAALRQNPRFWAF